MVKVVFLDGNLSDGPARKFEGSFIKQDAHSIYINVNGQIKVIGRQFIIKIEGISPEELGIMEEH